MKYLIILAALLSLTASASETNRTCGETKVSAEFKDQLEIKTDVPRHLKGATITIRLADGRESTVPAERFKVVPRKQQFLTTHTERLSVQSCETTVTEFQQRKNRLSLVGGYGATGGLTTPTATNPNTVEVESKVGLIGGLQYQRSLPLLNDRLSVGVQGQTSKTGSLLIGLDF